MVELIHPFIHRCHDITDLISGNKLATFCGKLEKQSILFPDRYDPDEYKGDGFELFVEALIKLSPIDNRIGITNYQSVAATNKIDVGVDGFGLEIVNLKPATVQIKYRSRNDSLLTANQDHLSNFVSTSLLHYGVDKEDKNSMIIITTADGLHHFTYNEMFLNKVRCIGYNQLREMVDDNKAFWSKFRESVTHLA